MSRTAAELVDAAQFLDRLASLPRTGWLLRGVTDVDAQTVKRYNPGAEP